MNNLTRIPDTSIKYSVVLLMRRGSSSRCRAMNNRTARTAPASTADTLLAARGSTGHATYQPVQSYAIRATTLI
eukprot:450075-Pleurochrysis_carterae.AAC.16